ncbi:hypothetical protein WJX72_004469 [[Myrmecia] bisecta]|uniref:MYND-type domain-containing protein n=1 Tax=[Myrmecia] bisecta TaxID=41462 RepID=A0AAW1P8U8_9CHLO
MEAECQVCGEPIAEPILCQNCLAMYYCSPKHQKRHWKMGHKDECQRMASQMQRCQELARFPFTFAAAPATPGQVDLSQAKTPSVQSVMSHCDTEASSIHMPEKPSCTSQGAMPETPADLSALCGMDPCEVPCWQLPVTLLLGTDITDWASYCKARGLTLSSPVAVLLHVPLTLFWILQQLHKRRPLLQSGRQLVIHIIGVQREVDQWPILLELSALLPDIHLHLALVSPDVPKRLHAASEVFCAPRQQQGGRATGSLRLTIYYGMYHDLLEELERDCGRADVVFGPNAGLAAYPSWIPTIQLLAAPLAPPAVFTDFCEEAAHRGAVMLQATAGKELSLPLKINPFRKPVRCTGRDNALPSYSNAFLFGIN